MSQKNLVDFVSEVSGESHLRIEHDYGDGFVRLHTSEADRRQAAQDIRNSEDIVIELLRNARDAHARRVFMAVSREGDKRTLTVVDDGDGIPPTLHETVFLPRVTSKLDTAQRDAWGFHGRGMALFSIAENSAEARIVDSYPQLGTSISVTTDLTQLPEKTDQSTFPRFIMGDDGTVSVRGPKNILRISCEFAIEARNECSIYVGSPAEIAATLYAYGLSRLSAVERAFCKDVGTLPLVKRLAVAAEPDDFARQSSALGLPLSERTARRIISGEIEEVEPLLEQISIEGATPKTRKRTRVRKRRPKFAKEEIDSLADSVLDAFEPLANRYYLESRIDPAIRFSSDKITITLPLVDRE